ncbi:hypothetical protein SAMN05192566_0723 [Methylophilus rhizosphaerae]|uniref:Uncharacterized protein n=1 Tax=Methylophilus rhizosphaerae TaxID=492660 RepID=A0A1G9A739_9PROT|nr:hypothetical protein [Methylophilus rhizosphaerae]SDK23103.1 hypothetical protein SAMN05192566_0723 [Methylophilus rhizosphaerae]
MKEKLNTLNCDDLWKFRRTYEIKIEKQKIKNLELLLEIDSLENILDEIKLMQLSKGFINQDDYEDYANYINEDEEDLPKLSNQDSCKDN